MRLIYIRIDDDSFDILDTSTLSPFPFHPFIRFGAFNASVRFLFFWTAKTGEGIVGLLGQEERLAELF
jgi:hypothetical protein